MKLIFNNTKFKMMRQIRQPVKARMKICQTVNHDLTRYLPSHQSVIDLHQSVINEIYSRKI
jgi:hypothetical protein